MPPHFRTPKVSLRTCVVASALDRNMVLAERCVLLSAEILKSQVKYSDAATLLIKMTSEVSKALQYIS